MPTDEESHGRCAQAIVLASHAVRRLQLGAEHHAAFRELLDAAVLIAPLCDPAAPGLGGPTARGAQLLWGEALLARREEAVTVEMDRAFSAAKAELHEGFASGCDETVK